MPQADTPPTQSPAVPAAGRRRWLLVAACLGLAIALWLHAERPAADPAPGSGPATDTAPAATAAADRGPLPWGLYDPSHWRRRGPGGPSADADLAEHPLGGRPRYAMTFAELGPRGFSERQIGGLLRAGQTPVVSLELIEWHRGGGPGDDKLAAIAAGDYDAWFTDWGKVAAAQDAEILLRFGYEMNGNWFAWGQRPEVFKAAWRRAHAAVTAAGATKVKWVFSANILYGDPAKTDFHLYYPGDDVVDMVGLDGYNFGDNHDQWHVWQSYREVFEPSIVAMQRYRKPLILTEVGCADDPRKAAWVRDFLTTVHADARICGFLWFHHDKRREGEPNWRLDSDPDTLAAFTAWTAKQTAEPPVDATDPGPPQGR